MRRTRGVEGKGVPFAPSRGLSRGPRPQRQSHKHDVLTDHLLAKRLECPNCSNAFVSLEGNRFLNLAPVLLSCGHYCCHECSRKPNPCPECCLVDFQVEISNMKHAYVVGLLCGDKQHSHFNQFPLKHEVRKVPPKATVNCEECGNKKTEVRCSICSTKLCQPCFKQIHFASSMKNHEALDINETSMQLPQCSSHPLKTCSIWCMTCSQEDKNKWVCIECILFGDHRTHQTIKGDDMLNEHMMRILNLSDSMAIAIADLKDSHANCQKLTESVSSQYEKVVQNVRMHTHRLHGILQLKEDLILREATHHADKLMFEFTELRTKFEEEINCRELLITDVQKVHTSPDLTLDIKRLCLELETMEKNFEKTVLIKQKPELFFRLELAQNVTETVDQLIKFSTVDEGFALVNSGSDMGAVASSGPISGDILHCDEKKRDSSVVGTVTGVVMEEVPKNETNSSAMKVANNIATASIMPVMKNAMVSAVDSQISSAINPTTDNPILKSSSSASQGLVPSGAGCKSIHPAKLYALSVDENTEVSHIHNPSEFYVQRGIDRKKLECIFSKVNTLARRSPVITMTPVVGDVFLCEFSHDKNWYRGQVMTWDTECDKGLVFYVDYGNSEIAPLACLRECPKEMGLEKMPSFAVLCGLCDLKPARGDQWDSEAIDLFRDMVGNTRLHFFVYRLDQTSNGPKYQVELRRPSSAVGVRYDLPVSIRDTLVLMGLSVYANDSPQDLYNQQASIVPRFDFLRPTVSFGCADSSVSMTHIVSPEEFYLQLATYAQPLLELMLEMQKHYVHEDVCNSIDWKVHVPKIGMLVVGRYSEDKRWYRCKITDLPGNKKVEVLYVDYGNKEILPFERIAKIPVKFVNLPAQALKCRLYGVAPFEDDWPTDIGYVIANLCENQILTAHFRTHVDNVMQVSLFVNNFDGESSDLADLLVGMQNARDVSNLSRRTGAARRNANQLGQEEKRKRLLRGHMALHQPISKKPDTGGSDQPLDGQAINVEFLSVVSPSCIFVRLLSHKDAYMHLQNDLEQQMLSMESFPDFQLNIGELCVHVTKDGNAARVKILSINSTSAKVFFVDDGTIKEAVLLTCLKELPQELKEKKRLALAVSLYGIKPPGGSNPWPGVTMDILREELMGKNGLYFVRRGKPFRENDADIKVLPVELGYFITEKGGPFEPHRKVHYSINESLIEDGVAIRDRDSLNRNNLIVTDASCDELPQQNQEIFGAVGGAAEETSANRKESPLPETSSPHVLRHKWVPASLPTTYVFQAVPTYVDTQCCIYLQPIENQDRIKMMVDTQSLQYLNQDVTDADMCWSPGDAVIARYHLDKKWYRATVLKLLDDNMVEVEMIDYGNIETAPIEDIRMNIIHPQIPVQCYKCILNNVTMASPSIVWETSVLDFVHLSVVEKKCQVKLVENPVEGEPLKITLFDLESNIDISDLLVNKMKVCRFIGVAAAISPSPMVPRNITSENRDIYSYPRHSQETKRESEKDSSDNFDVVIEPSDVSSDSEADISYPSEGSKLSVPSNSMPISVTLSSLPPHPMPTSKNETFLARVSAIIDPASVYLRVIELSGGTNRSDFLKQVWHYQQEFHHITETSKDIASNPEVAMPVVGSVYLTQFHVNNDDVHWFRVCVKSVRKKHCTVLYIDYGNTDVVAVEGLRNCPVSMTLIPCLAFPVRLHGVKPPGGQWSEEAMKLMIEILMESKDSFITRLKVMNAVEPMVELRLPSRSGLTVLPYMFLKDKGLITLSPDSEGDSDVD